MVGVLRWAAGLSGLALVVVIALAIIFSHYIMLALMIRFVAKAAQAREQRRLMRS